MTAGEFGQTQFDRMATVGMEQNLQDIEDMARKLYMRNPGQWRKSAPSLDAAMTRLIQEIDSRTSPKGLEGLHDIQIVTVSVDPAYAGDRVQAFTVGLADMLLAAHNGKRRFYVTDFLNADHVYNAAHNMAVAEWLLTTRKDKAGGPILWSSQVTQGVPNLSYERLFGQIIGRLELESSLLGESMRRVGIGYVQSLLFFNFLPVQ